MSAQGSPGLLASRIALVTGAASGGGRATALAMVREGAVVALADRSAEGAAETLTAVRARGGEGLYVGTDLSRTEEAEGLIARIVEMYGRLDCVWNYAGSYGEGFAGRLHECPEDSLDRWLELHLETVRVSLRYEIAQMLEQGAGAIVNTAGITGSAPSELPAASVASRYAVAGLTRAAAMDYAKRGIRVNAVFPAPPPLVARKRIPPAGESPASQLATHGPRTPEQVAEAVVWLCSDAASMVTGLTLGMERGLRAVFEE